MVLCFACSSDVPAKDLFRHVSAVHGHLSKFQCNESNCDRVFHLLDTFRKHRLKHHCDVPRRVIDVPVGHESEVNQVCTGNVDTTIANMAIDNDECVHDSLREDSNIQSDTDDHDDPVKSAPIIPSATKLLSKLHSYMDINRTRIVSISQDFSNFMYCEAKLLEYLFQSYIREPTPENESKMKDAISALKNPFFKLNTLHLQLAKFEELGTYIPPVQIKLGQRKEFRKRKNKFVQCMVKTTAEFISMRRVLKAIFELPNMYEKTVSYIQSLIDEDPDVISNFMQGNYWRNKLENFSNNHLLPIFLYFDDFENNNPLGTHAGISNCGGVYIILPGLPPEFASKLENILLFVLFNTLDRKQFKNKIIFHRAITEIKCLNRNGISVITDGKQHEIFFELVLILGDNLGLNSILGFVESFRASHPCRFCLTDSANFSKVFNEDDVVLRTEKNYAEHLEMDDVKVTGIKEECVFHKLDSFHVARNRSCDFMHDGLEGVHAYDIAEILYIFIYDKNYFTLQHLNERIHGFPYQSWENKPPEIFESQLSRNVKRLKTSSSEMISLVRNFSLIIGDYVPKDDPYWELFLKLYDLNNIIMSPAHHREMPIHLKYLIEEYLRLRMKLFPNSPLKPKHHNLIHYPSIMRDFGPLWKISSMRAESRHSEGKKASRAAICRINVCHTIAVKTQLKQSYRFMSQSTSSEVIWEYAAPHKINNVNDLPHYSEFKHCLPLNTSQLSTLNWISFFKKKIEPEHNIIISYKENGISPIFYVIRCFVMTENGDLFILCTIGRDYAFHNHFQCFELLETSNKNEWIALRKEIVERSFISQIYKTSEGRSFIMSF